MRILAVIGALAIVIGLGAAAFFFGGFYSVAATAEDPAIGMPLSVGQAILPAAAFPGSFFGHLRVIAPRRSRLKAGCSQDWLPHKTGRTSAARQQVPPPI